MTAQTKTVIKTYFETGDTPTQAQFGDLIDSYQDYSSVLSTLTSSATGIVTKSSAGGLVARTIEGTANEIAVSAGSGVTGNPVIALASSVDLTGKELLVATASANDNGTRAANTSFVRSYVSAATLITPLRAVLGADVDLSNTSNYFDGPSVAQGSTGNFLATATITVTDTAGAAEIYGKLWDGVNSAKASTICRVNGANANSTLTLSAIFSAPAGDIRISGRDVSSTAGKILFNATGNSTDSVLSVIRLGGS